jgi:hypothetical protein
MDDKTLGQMSVPEFTAWTMFTMYWWVLALVILVVIIAVKYN